MPVARQQFIGRIWLFPQFIAPWTARYCTGYRGLFFIVSTLKVFLKNYCAYNQVVNFAKVDFAL